jgi:Tfp pilus assembly protein PilF
MNRIDRLKEFLVSDPNDSFVQHALALEYVKEGNDEEAACLFENLLKANENYIGSYYHLAKLHERQGRTEDAIRVYETGMKKAKEAGDNHAFSELRSAYEELTF